ncbi:11007_t:CDS:1, partial [Racocetra persica]
ESLASEHFGTESITSDCAIEMQPFIWDGVSFEEARMMVDIDEDEELTWEDLDIETKNNDINLASILEPELEEDNNNINLASILKSEKDIDSQDQDLTSCVLLNMIDSCIQCCSNKTERQRPLTQLVGTWKIDKDIVLELKKKNKLHTL